MIRKNILITASLAFAFLFVGCAKSTAGENRLNKVYETNYPDGISVTLGHQLLRNDLRISDARLSSGKYKKQVQFTINNSSNNHYTTMVIAQWLDKRGNIISSYPSKKRVRLAGGGSKRVMFNAPNTRAKDVAIEIECTSNKCE